MNRRRSFFASALVICLSLAAAGCDDSHSCTAIGCAGNRFALATEGWMPGEYEVELRYTLGGEQAFVCTFIVEDPDASGSAGDDAGPPGYESTCRQTKGEGRAVHLYPDAVDAPTVEVYDAPSELRLILRAADQTLFDDAIRPEYVTSYPNGPDCGACRSASMTLTLL